jgi:HD-like signal output (HDOD) protein
MQAHIKIEIPPRPEVLINLSRETGKEDPSIPNIVSILEKDVGLAGGVLGLSNSSMFGGSGKFVGLKEAVIYLGLSTISSFATAVVIKRTLGSEKASLRFFWDKSTAIAAECDAVSSHGFFKSLKVSQSRTFTASLLRDCGQAILVMNFPDCEQKIGNEKLGLCANLKELEEKHYGIAHPRIGHMLCHYWGIPELVCEAIRDHHEESAYKLEKSSEKLAYMAIGHLGHIRYLSKKKLYTQEGDVVLSAIKAAYAMSDELVEELMTIEREI